MDLRERMIKACTANDVEAVQYILMTGGARMEWYADVLPTLVDAIMSSFSFNFGRTREDSCEMLRVLMAYAHARGLVMQPIASKKSLGYLNTWDTPTVVLKVLAFGVALQFPPRSEFTEDNPRYFRSVLPRRQLLALIPLLGGGRFHKKVNTDVLRTLMPYIVDDSGWVPREVILF